MWTWFYRLGSPRWFYETAERWIPRLQWLALAVLLVGLAWGLLFSPRDYQQSETVRIMYVHVPAAFLSMAVYMTMALASVIGLVWRMKMSYMVAVSCAPIGAAFTFLALFTGAVWGKPMWGTWWVWDARLTSELILLFLYFGYMALHHAIDERDTADKAAGILAIVGVINIPIIHFSVEWWNTLHQGASISKFDKPSMDSSMLWPLLIMIVAFKLWFVWSLFIRLRNEILRREWRSQWVGELLACNLKR